MRRGGHYSRKAAIPAQISSSSDWHGIEAVEQHRDGAGDPWAQIKARNDHLDIAWLRDEEADAEVRLTEPEDIAAAIIVQLRAALAEIEALTEELEPEGNPETMRAAE